MVTYLKLSSEFICLLDRATYTQDNPISKSFHLTSMSDRYVSVETTLPSVVCITCILFGESWIDSNLWKHWHHEYPFQADATHGEYLHVDFTASRPRTRSQHPKRRPSSTTSWNMVDIEYEKTAFVGRLGLNAHRLAFGASIDLLFSECFRLVSRNSMVDLRMWETDGQKDAV